MRAAILHGSNDLRIEEVPDPFPGPGEALVRIETATSCGLDIQMLKQGHPALPRYPCPFGHEMAGVVVETDGGIAPGTRVGVNGASSCGTCVSCRRDRPTACTRAGHIFGGYAEMIAVPIEQLEPIPDTMSSIAAAMAEQLACAVHAVRRAEARTDDRLAVLGAGPMGLFLADLAVRGATQVTVVDHRPERLEVAASLGADTLEGTPDRLNSKSFDIVLEALSTPESWTEAVRAAAPGGVVVLVGDCAPDAATRLAMGPIHYGELDLRGVYHHTTEDYREAIELLGNDRVDWQPLAGPTIDLEEVPDAFNSESAPGPLKFVVRPSSDR